MRVVGHKGVVFGRRAILALTAMIWVMHALILLECKPLFFQPGYLTEAYDQLALNLLNGESVKASPYIAFEGMGPGRDYMYFGILPALVRIVPLIVWPEHFLAFGYLSLLLCQTVFLFFVARALIDLLHHSSEASLGVKGIAAMFCLLGFGLGSPVTSILSKQIYHEALLWSVALFTGVMCCTFRLIYGDNRRINLFLLGTLSALTLLSRLTFGLSCYLLCSIFIIQLVFKVVQNGGSLRRRSVIDLLLCVVPLVLGVLVQLAYNYGRFGSPFKFIDMEEWDLARSTPERYEVLTAQGSFLLARIRYTAEIYLSPLFYESIDDFPYVLMRGFEDPKLFFMNALVLPISIGSPWLILGGIVGGIQLIKARSFQLLSVVAIFLLQALLILAYLATMQRYTTEFLPLLSFLSIFWLYKLESARSSGVMIGVFAVTVIFSICMTLGVFFHLRCDESCEENPAAGCDYLPGRIIV